MSNNNNTTSVDEALYYEVLQKDPHNAAAWHHLANIEFKKASYQKAVSFIEQALIINPHNPVWWVDYGNIIAAGGEASEAAIRYEQAFIINAKNMISVGNIESALHSYEQILRFNPNNEDAKKALTTLGNLGLINGQTSEDPLVILDALSRHLSNTGQPIEAAAINAAIKKLISAGTYAQNSDLRLCSVKDRYQWACDNGFKLSSISLPISVQPDDSILSFIPFWSTAVKEFLASEPRTADFIHTNNTIVCTFGWPTSPPVSVAHQQIDLFSSSYDFLVENRYWLTALEGKGIFRFAAQDKSSILIDFRNSRIESINTKAVLVGCTGQQNWGHWLQDILPRLVACLEIDELHDAKLVFGPLRESQRECLSLLGISPSRILELEVRPQVATRYIFANLTYISTVPKDAAAAILRRRFAAALGRKTQQPNLVYFSRRHEVPRHRLGNINEVEELLRRKGFCIIEDSKNMRTEDLVSLLSNVKVIVVPAGAEGGNVVMCRENAVVVNLNTEHLLARFDSETLRNHYFPWLLGTGLSTVFVFGKPVNPLDLSVDGLINIDPGLLEKAIDYAIELSGAQDAAADENSERSFAPKYQAFYDDLNFANPF